VSRLVKLASFEKPESGAHVDGPGLVVEQAATMVRFISGTDNYLCFEDNGERLVVVKLNYQAEESVGIVGK
jgi:hypothetical protein